MRLAGDRLGRLIATPPRCAQTDLGPAADTNAGGRLQTRNRTGIPLVRGVVASFETQHRRDALEQQLMGLIAYVSSGLRSGQSFAQTLEAAAQEIDPPLGPHLQQVVEEYRVGVPIGEALGILSEKLRHPDVEYFIRVMNVYRSTGGDLTEALGSTGESIRERGVWRAEVKAKCADARLSALVLSVMPAVLGLYVASFQRDMFRVLVCSPLGRAGLVYACVSWAVGLIAIGRVTRIDHV